MTVHTFMFRYTTHGIHQAVSDAATIEDFCADHIKVERQMTGPLLSELVKRFECLDPIRILTPMRHVLRHLDPSATF